MAYSGAQSSADEAQVVDEAGEHGLPVVGAQDRARMDRRRHELGELRVQGLAAVLGDLEALTEEALGRRRAEQDERPRLHERDLGLEPRAARHLLGPRRLVVDAARPARL